MPLLLHYSQSQMKKISLCSFPLLVLQFRLHRFSNIFLRHSDKFSLSADGAEKQDSSIFSCNINILIRTEYQCIYKVPMFVYLSVNNVQRDGSVLKWKATLTLRS